MDKKRYDSNRERKKSTVTYLEIRNTNYILGHIKSHCL